MRGEYQDVTLCDEKFSKSSGKIKMLLQVSLNEPEVQWSSK